MVNIEREIRFIDLFGGVGGFRLGLERCNVHKEEEERAGEENEEGIRERGDRFDDEGNKGLGNSEAETFKHHKWGADRQFNCVWYCDSDKFAVQTYNKNFKENHSSADIREVGADQIPDFELLCAGFPCQSFSIAGKREGFEDTRGTLFFEICRIARDKRPPLLLLENVRGLLSHDGGTTFQIILESLDELGYDVEWEVLNSKHFGVPQNRQRVFIVGHLGGFPERKVFPIGRTGGFPDGKDGKTQESGERVCSTLHKGYNRLQGQGETYVKSVQLTNKNRGKKPYNPDEREMMLKISDDDASYTVKSALHEFMLLKTNTKKGYDIAEEGDGVRLEFPNSKTARGRVVKGKSNSLKTGATEGVVHNNKIRRLTPVECERLQGFPDDWTKGVSDTQRYKQMGNAVTVNVIQAIGESILESYKEVD